MDNPQQIAQLSAASLRLSDLSLSRAELEAHLAPQLQQLDRLRLAEAEALGEYQRLRRQSGPAEESPPESNPSTVTE